MEINAVDVKTIEIKKDMEYKGEKVLTYTIKYPSFKSNRYQLSLKYINQYYEKRAREYQHYIENDLYKMAVKEYEYSKENNFPVRVFEAMDVFKITLNSACIISLYFDRYEYTGGAHGSTIRSSQTWNIPKYDMIKLKELYKCPGDYKKYIISQVIEQIKKNPTIYFDDYESLAVKTFNENSYYCTSRGIVVYYQQYDIAPYASGIREFPIPYGRCIADPRSKCF